MSADGRLALVLVLVLAPFALVLLAAIVRGYTIDLHMTRDVRPRRWRRRHADDDADGA